MCMMYEGILLNGRTSAIAAERMNKFYTLVVPNGRFFDNKQLINKPLVP